VQGFGADEFDALAGRRASAIAGATNGPGFRDPRQAMTTTQQAAPPPVLTSSALENPHHARRWMILGVLGIAQLMVVLDATIVNIALPSAQIDLGFSNDNRQWVVTAYALAFGSLLLLGGRIGDLIGRKRVLLIGLVGFAAASAIGGAATGFGMLVFARALQGMFGALLAPAVLSLLTTTFTDAKERGKAFAIYGAIAGTGGAIGLLLGGALTEYLDWRWCMYVNVVLAVAACAGAGTLLHHQRSAERPKLDLPGTLSVTAGLFGLVYGFSNAETKGWHAGQTWGWLVAGVLLLAVFVGLQTRVAHPLLPLRVVLNRARGGSYLAVFMIGIGMFGIFLFLTYFLQQNLGFSPIISGVAFLPMVFSLMIGATTSTTMLLPRFGPRPLVFVGMLLGAGAMLWMSRLTVDSSYAGGVLGPLVFMGLGIGLTMAPSMNTATAGVQPQDAGVASATVNTAQQIGGSIGTAVLSTLAATAATNFMAGKTPTALVQAQAAVHSYTTAFLWVSAVFAVGAVICAAVLPSKVPAPDPDAAPAAHM
jgi:EmrB/QacA subfamily drug resistance transporter